MYGDIGSKDIATASELKKSNENTHYRFHFEKIFKKHNLYLETVRLLRKLHSPDGPGVGSNLPRLFEANESGCTFRFLGTPVLGPAWGEDGLDTGSGRLKYPLGPAWGESAALMSLSSTTYYSSLRHSSFILYFVLACKKALLVLQGGSEDWIFHRARKQRSARPGNQRLAIQLKLALVTTHTRQRQTW